MTFMAIPSNTNKSKNSPALVLKDDLTLAPWTFVHSRGFKSLRKNELRQSMSLQKMSTSPARRPSDAGNVTPPTEAASRARQLSAPVIPAASHGNDAAANKLRSRLSPPRWQGARAASPPPEVATFSPSNSQALGTPQSQKEDPALSNLSGLSSVLHGSEDRSTQLSHISFKMDGISCYAPARSLAESAGCVPFQPVQFQQIPTDSNRFQQIPTDSMSISWHQLPYFCRNVDLLCVLTSPVPPAPHGSEEATRNEAPVAELGSDASARIQILFGEKRRAFFHSNWEVLMGQGEVQNWMRSRPDKEVPMRYPGEWKFAGGVVDADETPLQAAMRELEEEFQVPIALTEATCKLRLLSVKQTRPIRNVSNIMFNYVAAADENPWLQELDLEDRAGK
eukprot:s689_g26.t1